MRHLLFLPQIKNDLENNKFWVVLEQNTNTIIIIGVWEWKI